MGELSRTQQQGVAVSKSSYGIERQQALVLALKKDDALALASLTVDLTAKSIVYDRLAKYGKEEVPKTLRALSGDQDTLKQLSLLVIDLCDTFNVSNNMNEKQVMSAAVSIMGAFPQLTLLDIAACFKEAKTGAYGKVFRLDAPTICEFLSQYDVERTEHIVAFRQKENEQWKHSTTSSEEVKKSYEKLINEAAEEAAKREEELKKKRNNEFQSEINRRKFHEEYGTNQHREEPKSVEDASGSKSRGDSGATASKAG